MSLPIVLQTFPRLCWPKIIGYLFSQSIIIFLSVICIGTEIASERWPFVLLPDFNYWHRDCFRKMTFCFVYQIPSELHCSLTPVQSYHYCIVLTVDWLIYWLILWNKTTDFISWNTTPLILMIRYSLLQVHQSLWGWQETLQGSSAPNTASESVEIPTSLYKQLRNRYIWHWWYSSVSSKCHSSFIMYIRLYFLLWLCFNWSHNKYNIMLSRVNVMLTKNLLGALITVLYFFTPRWNK